MPPETRHSLIQRLQDGGDNAAWEEFASIYRPVIVRIALRKQMQFDDAEDLAQQVLLLVLKNINKWKSDPARARFRTWLQTVVRNATMNALSRRPKDQASGGTDSLQQLHQRPDKSDSLSFDLEWQRETLRWVAQQVRGEFESTTWTAFWDTAIEQLPAQEVAEKIGRSVGAVYIARSRVMQRIKQRIAELDDDSITQ
ncbi:MAG: sigma-70 family RNA polymerase sigma factor [Pirellula sp.]|nr:sigma-70 family RNA polymerase sigma factor [Pirellula sp.]